VAGATSAGTRGGDVASGHAFLFGRSGASISHKTLKEKIPHLFEIINYKSSKKGTSCNTLVLSMH
jgi:hypothetical protein